MQYLVTIYSIPGIPLAGAGIPIAKYKIDSLDKQEHGTHREITPTVPSGLDLPVH